MQFKYSVMYSSIKPRAPELKSVRLLEQVRERIRYLHYSQCLLLGVQFELLEYRFVSGAAFWVQHDGLGESRFLVPNLPS